MFDKTKKWKLEVEAQSITINNAKEIVKEVEMLLKQIFSKTSLEVSKPVGSFHIRWKAHVLNLAFKDCLTLINDYVGKIRKLLSFIRCSIKRWDTYNNAWIELGMKCELPSLDVEIMWPPTFQMNRKSYEARSVLSAVAAREKDVSSLMVSESEWMLANKIGNILNAAATATEHQSGLKYVTLSFTEKLFQKLKLRCREYIEKDESPLKEITEAMRRKLQHYLLLVNTPAARFARVFDLRFRTSILIDAEILRSLVPLPDPDLEVSSEKRTKNGCRYWTTYYRKTAGNLLGTMK